jgi:hypothetical protein
MSYLPQLALNSNQRNHKSLKTAATLLLAVMLGLNACVPGSAVTPAAPLITSPTTAAISLPLATAMPARPSYAPGQLVDYIAQDGDSVPALAQRFNTTVAEIMSANPIIPRDATTMPPGFPMKIPIYYRALWGSPFQSFPDNAFVNGPLLIGFNTTAYVLDSNGWLKNFRAYAGGDWRDGPNLVHYVAKNFSISPRLLLALLEYQTGALSRPDAPPGRYALGHRQVYYESLYLQLVWAANTLNNGYYGWRGGTLIEFDLADDTLLRPDPWQNAASVAIQYYFSRIYAGDKFAEAIGPDGLLKTYTQLFGNPWEVDSTLIPGSLRQPELSLPFPAGYVWSYTGGPHTGWGTGQPYTAIDFAPPSDFSGCFKVDERQYSTAMADGLIVRSEIDGVVLDLDKDGDERTGWVIYYLHLAAAGRVPAGSEVKVGDPIGYPSCEGGRVTGTHVHIGRKFNGEWVLTGGSIPFVMDGWMVANGTTAYKGKLLRAGREVIACECSDAGSTLRADPP